MTPLMLPVAPKDVGRLSDVFLSALASVSEGVENRLRLPKVRHAVVILVDGLGYENLKRSPAYARFLNQNLDISIRCEFPSTTATSIAGFATGLRSNDHGLIGYSAYDRSTKKTLNLLTGWNSKVEAEAFRKVVTISNLSGDVPVFSVGPKAYENTGFTALTMPGASYVSADALADRFEAVEKIILRENSSLTYLYIPELDQLAHRFGVESDNWLFALEELDLIVNRFHSKLSGSVGVILTADHGVVDVPLENQIYLDEFEWYSSQVQTSTGDPRCNFVYVTPEASIENLRGALESEFGQVAYIATPSQMSAAGWLGPFDANAAGALPDLYIIWRENRVAYDRRFAKPTHLKMIGQHGGISDVETRVPLIKLGKY